MVKLSVKGGKGWWMGRYRREKCDNYVSQKCLPAWMWSGDEEVCFGYFADTGVALEQRVLVPILSPCQLVADPTAHTPSEAAEAKFC